MIELWQFAYGILFANLYELKSIEMDFSPTTLLIHSMYLSAKSVESNYFHSIIWIDLPQTNCKIDNAPQAIKWII